MRIELLVATACVLVPLNAAMAETVPRNPTYSRDIAPLFSENCVQCHRPGDIAPMSLLTYEEVRPWAKSIRKVVEERTMPPWHADAGIGEFSNDRSLEQHEIDTILRWVKRGAKEGNPSDLPPAAKLGNEGWRLGKPDLVVRFEEVALQAGGPDQFFDLAGDPGLSVDTWIRGIQVRPSNRKVAHHVIVWQKSEEGTQGWLGAWAAGMDPMEFPGNSGRLLKAGTQLVGDMHYHPAETPESDRTQVALYFAKDNEVEKELVNLWIQNASFEIPAGNANYGARATHTFRQDSYVLSLMPHMHYRGKDFVYTARFPDGRKEELLRVSGYDFNWQTSYVLEEPLYVPEGTRIDCVAHWDNSADNPNNPDPTISVRFGPESYDEMMIGFIDYIVKDGVGPLSPKAEAERYAREREANYPGEVYYADVIADGQIFIGVLHMPRDASPGVWHVNLLGTVQDVPLEDLAWTANAFSARVSIIGQVFDLTGTVDPTSGVLEGRVQEVTNANNTAPVRGRRVEPGE